jgi:hypothetical protein
MICTRHCKHTRTICSTEQTHARAQEHSYCRKLLYWHPILRLAVTNLCWRFLLSVDFGQRLHCVFTVDVVQGVVHGEERCQLPATVRGRVRGAVRATSLCRRALQMPRLFLRRLDVLLGESTSTTMCELTRKCEMRGKM